MAVPKVAQARKPYRFCVPCWVKLKQFVIKAAHTPDGRTRQLGGHTQTTCPVWGDRPEPTPEENRAYGAAFKRAARQTTLRDIAFRTFKENFPDLRDEQILAHVS